MRDALGRIQAAVVRHPRLLITLLIISLLIVAADPAVATETGVDPSLDLEFTTNGEGAIDDGGGSDGPTNP
jgi:hypothetical protein